MAYRPAEQARYADIRARGAANEHRHSQFKHGGGPAKTAARREYSDEELFGDGPSLSDDEMDDVAGLSDDEMDNLAGLSDEELFADGDVTPVLRKDEATGRDERTAAQALNWLDLGWGVGDEIVGGIAATGEFISSGGDTARAGKAYQSEADYANDLKRRYQAQTDTTVGDVVSTAGGILLGAPAGLGLFRGGQLAARALTGGRAACKLGRGAQNAAALGLTGAAATEAQQFGNATGTPAERLEQVQAGGVVPAMVGAGLGIAAGGLGAGGVKLAQRGAQALRSSDSKAARYIAEKLLGAGQTADDLERAHAQAAQTGKPVALADVGPQGVKDAAAVSARTPGPGRETAQAALVPRQEGQVARVSDDVGQAVGGKPGSFTQTADDISAQRAAEAKPLYDEAFSKNAPVVSKKIVEIANRPSGKAAIQKGLKIAADEGIPESQLVIRDANGNIIGYSAKGLHYAKMALDDMIEAAKRTGDLSAARAFTIMKKELLTEMDAKIPGYAKAREVLAGHSANKSALESGRQAVNSHPDQIKSQMAGMSQSEREMYKRGFAQRVIEEVERSPDAGNAARRIFGNTAKRERLRAVLGDDEYNRLAEKLGVEDAMYGSFRRSNVGSETAERVAAQNDFDDYIVGQYPNIISGFARSYASGSVTPLIRAISMSGIAQLLRGIGQRTRGQIAKMLFSSNPAEVRQGIAAIRREHGAALRAQKATDAAMASAAANDDARVAGGIVAGQTYGMLPSQLF